MSNIFALYHIVFSTKHRRDTLPLHACHHLYSHIGALVKENKCFIHNIGGMPNHVHIMLGLHQDVALSALIREIKSKTSRFLTHHPEFIHFQGWGSGYYAATISYTHHDGLYKYIADQHKHHGAESFDDELERLVRINGMNLHPEDYR